MKLGLFARLGRKGGLWFVAVSLIVLIAYPAWAVIFAPKNSVITKSIKKGAVTSAKIKDRTLTNADIADGAAIAASKIAGGAWTSANDGSGSGLDADKVDGQHASGFVAKNGDTMSGALTASNFAYGSPRTGYLSIYAHTFSPYDSLYAYSNYGWGLVATGSGNEYFVAPVNLPQGAVITGFQFSYYDNHWSDIQAWLRRRDDGDGGADISTAQSNSAASFNRTASGPIDASYATVDNANYSYYVDLELYGGAPQGVLRVLITYTYSAPGH